MDRIISLEAEIAELQNALLLKEQELHEIKRNVLSSNQENGTLDSSQSNVVDDRLPKWAIERYSRQILLPEIGVPGQLKLCKAKVLIVGAGGLGCPAALYLAGAGVGEIGLVDYDTVDLTNLHRQTLHTESSRGLKKVESAAQSLKNINSHIKVTPYHTQLDSSNALEIASKYDLILDCTDNVPTRYLLNDVCVFIKKPLISGSALKTDGQITIYGYKSDASQDQNGPCYRCLFPTPPPPETVGSCSANGVLGAITGVIGSLQALEAIKYIAGHTRDKLLVGRMLLLDGEDTTFRTVKLRGQNPECAVCSKTPTITQLVDYEMFCQAQAKEKDLELKILPLQHRITAMELSSKLEQRPLVVDVRNENEFHMCHIEGSVNYPIENLEGEGFEQLLGVIERCSDVIFLCRRGNDSQIVTQRVIDALNKENNLASKKKDLDSERKDLESDRKDLEPERKDLEPERKDLESERKDLEPERKYLEPERKDLESERKDLEPERKYLEPERKDLESERKDLEPERKYLGPERKYLESKKRDPESDKKDLITNKEDLNKDNNTIALKVKDLIGGLHAWAKYVDREFPVY